MNGILSTHSMAPNRADVPFCAVGTPAERGVDHGDRQQGQAEVGGLRVESAGKAAAANQANPANG